MHLYCDTGSLGKSTPEWGVKSLLFSHIPNIFAVHILSKIEGKSTALQLTFYKLFLSDINVKILINSWYFLMVFFLDVSSDVLWLAPSVFSKWNGLFQKKTNRGWMIWDFQEYWRNSKWIFLGLIKNNIEFLGVIKKKLCGISRGLHFGSWNFWGVWYNFV